VEVVSGLTGRNRDLTRLKLVFSVPTPGSGAKPISKNILIKNKMSHQDFLSFFIFTPWVKLIIMITKLKILSKKKPLLMREGASKELQ